MITLLKKDQTREVIFNGPIKTGIELDSRKLLVKGYKTLQEDIRCALSETIIGLWNYPSTDGRANGMTLDIDDKRGKTVIPKFFMSRILQEEELIQALDKAGLPLEIDCPVDEDTETSSAARFIITRIEIRTYDFGYGSVLFNGQVRAHRDLSVLEFKSAVERISSGLSNFAHIFKETFEAIDTLVPQDARQIDMTKLSGIKPTEEALNMRPRQDVGGVLWIHRIFLIECEDAEDYEHLREACKVLVYSSDAESMEDTGLTPGLSFYGGSGNSAAVYDKSRADMHDVMLLPRIIQAHNVYFSKAEEYDYALFYYNNDLSLMREDSASSSELEELSKHIIEFKSQIVFFKSIYDDYDNHLDPQSMEIWFSLAQSWNTIDRFEGVNQKLSSLEKIYDRVMQDLNNIQNKKLNAFVLLFTLLSMLSVVVDTVDFTQGGSLESPVFARVAILMLMGILLITVAGRLVRRR